MSFSATPSLGMDPCSQIRYFTEGTNEDIAEIGGGKKPRMHKGTWNQHRDILRRLYMDENQPLGDVMRIMKEKHNFKPTVKQCRSTYLTIDRQSFDPIVSI
ncbi:hypothetical protein GGR55DRAFT_683566 [Xylaria sp. FL0064]|nr:hypothetical protein GGR55DRAFT_683566 [Xylaria sp. FL0064]